MMSIMSCGHDSTTDDMCSGCYDDLLMESMELVASLLELCNKPRGKIAKEARAFINAHKCRWARLVEEGMRV
jgi:hypothetical protein